MKNIKAIIFDAYGTLFDVNSAAEKCKDKIGDKWEGFANYWRTTQLEYTWLRSLMKRHKDFWQVTEESLDKSMKAYEIDSSMRNVLLDLYKILSPFKEVPEVLKSLKDKNLKLAILSNGTPSLLNQLVKSNNLDNLFDVIHNYDLSVSKNEERFIDCLSMQVCSPVRWIETMQIFKNNDISDVIEVGPGNVLHGLVKRFDKTLRVHSFSNIEDINSIKQVL